MKGEKLYYEGHCPLCSAEIKKLRRLAVTPLQLVDIHAVTQAENLPPRVG